MRAITGRAFAMHRRRASRVVSHLNGRGATDLAAATGVVQPPHERPQELDAARKQLAEVRQDDEEHRDPEDGVNDRDGSTCVRARRDVSVSWKRKKTGGA